MRHFRTPLPGRFARPAVLPALLCVAALTVASCSDSAEAGKSSSTSPAGSASASASASSDSASPSPVSPSPSAGTSTSTSASPTPARTPARTPAGTPSRLPTIRRNATNLHVAILQSSVARTPEEKAVVAVWMTYWQAATDSTYLAREDPGLAEVAVGQARSSILGLLRQNKAAGQRGVGWAKDNITRVTVSGDRATVRDCTQNFTFNIDEEGTPASKPFPWYDARGRLEKRDGRWVVVRAVSPSRTNSCLR